MQLEILCTPKFDSEESSAVDAIATLLGISREDAVREAVKFFAAECVPTHKANGKPNPSSCRMCAHTRRGHARACAHAGC